MGKAGTALARWWSGPGAADPAWWAASARWVADLARHCAREMDHDRAFEMAAALTYRTIFSLVPSFILALVVFNAFGGLQNRGEQIGNRVADFLGLNSLEVPLSGGHEHSLDPRRRAASGEEAPAAPPQSGAATEKRAQFTKLFTDMTRHVAGQRFGGIGLMGGVLLVWAGIALLVTIERTFNRIFNCPAGRPWVSRVVIYWSVLTLGPLLVFASRYLTDVVAGKLQLTRLALLGHLTWVPALLASWLLLFLLYLLMPNTRVRSRPALLGSLVTAALYEVTKVGFQLYVHRAVPYAKLYASLALIPLFLLWIYLTWIIVLFGLELTYTLQAMRGRTFKHLQAHGDGVLAGDPLWIVSVMAAIGRAFAAGKTVTVAEVSGQTGISVLAVTELLRRLESEGLVHRVFRVGARDVTLALSLPADKIELTRLLDLGTPLSAAAGAGPDQARRPGQAVLARLAEAQRRAAADTTLATLLAEK